MCLSRLIHTAFGLAVYASQAPSRDRPTQDSLPAGGQPLPGRAFTCRVPSEKFPLCRRLSTSLPPLPGLPWRTSSSTCSRPSFLDTFVERKQHVMRLRILSCTLLLTLSVLSAPAWAAKVNVCHRPPGNPANFHTINISENALQAHLGHGDLAGTCGENCQALCDDGNACTQDVDPSSGDCACLAEHPPVVCGPGGICTPETGVCVSSCCLAHDTPGCAPQSCSDIVCERDGFCCAVFWDQLCANEAFSQCAPLCD